MRLLRYPVILLLLIVMSLISCKSGGALSPEEAYFSLRDAFIKSDAGKVEKLLSERSILKIGKIIDMISSMPDSQLEALGRSFSTDAASLKNLTVKNYLALQMSLSKKISEDIFKEIIKNDIVGIDQYDSTANVRMENGMELIFVKEGPYWKFDMEELSSEN
ncbi:MAG: hypothetical protein JW864_12475 [Spirochaetes bacterium]|nr:hypothetical protein [Spirochaetota bacterium]